MLKTAWYSVIGIILIGAGLFLSSTDLVTFLRPFQKSDQEILITGVLLFKFGLILTGISAIILGKLARFFLQENIATPEKHGRLGWAVFLAVLCVAALLRFYKLNEGLWLDEILTQVNYTKTSFREIFTTYDSQNQHFLYSLLTRLFFLLFGESAWSLRFPAVLFGLASIWALYIVSAEVSSKREALLACALLAVSYHHIWFSQNARGYTGLLFFTLISSWLLIRGFSDNNMQQWVWYGIVSALGAFTHITMVIIVIAHFMIYVLHLYRHRREPLIHRWMPMIGFVLAGILTFQLYALVLPQMLGGVLSQGSIVASWKNPLWTLMEFIKGVKIGLKGLVPGMLGLGIFIAGIWSFIRRKPIVIGMLFIPTMFVAVLSIAMGHHLWPRLFFFAFGFIVLVLVNGCMQLGKVFVSFFNFRQKKATQFGTAFFSIIIIASAISVPSVYGPKQDYSGALSFVENNRKETDAVYSIGSAQFVYKNFYKVDWKSAESVEEIETIMTSSKRVWFIYTLPYYLETVYPEIMQLVKQRFTVVKRYFGTLNGGEIYVCRTL